MGRSSGNGMSVADHNFGVLAQSILPNVNENLSHLHAKMSEPFSANGSFLDAKSQSTGPQLTTTSDILFLKRLLFLKAALDNDMSSSNFAVPFDENTAFRMTHSDAQHPGMIANENRAGVQTAPVGGYGRRKKSAEPVYMLEDEEEKPLALTNGGNNDDMYGSLPQMKAVQSPDMHQ